MINHSPFESSGMIRNYLQKWLQVQEGMSIRSWAKLMSLSHTYLSLVLASKRLVSIEALAKICETLDLDFLSKKNIFEARERDWLRLKKVNISEALNLGEVSTTNSAKHAEEILDSSLLLKSWIYMALLDFTTCEGFVEDETVLSQYFNIPKGTLRRAIKELEDAGYFKRDGNQKLIKTVENIRVSVPRSNKAIRAFHIAMMKKAIKTLEEQPATKNVISKRLINSYTVAVNEQQLPYVFEKINSAFQSIVDDLRSGSCQTVYQVQFQILPLIKPKTKTR